jgi:hypothetical protein
MSIRLSRLHRITRIAVAALILSAVPPAGAHGHAAAPGFEGHADFCSAVGGNPQPATPIPADRSQRACTHCDGCAGHADNGWALPPALVTSFALGAQPIAPVAFAPAVPTPVEQIAARPRGPPFSA